MIRHCDPGAANHAPRAEIDAAIRRVLDSGWYILGAEVEAFEKEFARFLGEGQVIGVASGTDAIEIALRALGLGAGDAVLTVSHTAGATVSAIERMGAIPVLADIDPRTFTLSAASAERCLRHYPQLRFKAIVPVHLYGQMAAMDEILALAREHRLAVVEDCAQAHGAAWRGQSAGTVGDAGAFSFYPTKNLGALGDGGAVFTRSPALAERLRQLRQYGWNRRHISESHGINSRLDELQAAILRVKLPGLQAGNLRRQEIAARYHDALRDMVTIPHVAPDSTRHVWHQYTIRTGSRDTLQSFLAGQGIATAILYPVPIHLQPAFRDTCHIDPRGLPETEKAACEILSLPVYPGLPDDAVATVCEAVRSFFRNASSAGR